MILAIKKLNISAPAFELNFSVGTEQNIFIGMYVACSCLRSMGFKFSQEQFEEAHHKMMSNYNSLKSLRTDVKIDKLTFLFSYNLQNGTVICEVTQTPSPIMMGIKDMIISQSKEKFVVAFGVGDERNIEVGTFIINSCLASVGLALPTAQFNSVTLNFKQGYNDLRHKIIGITLSEVSFSFVFDRNTHETICRVMEEPKNIQM